MFVTDVRRGLVGGLCTDETTKTEPRGLTITLSEKKSLEHPQRVPCLETVDHNKYILFAFRVLPRGSRWAWSRWSRADRTVVYTVTAALR